MTATKILWGQILLVLATAVAGVWGATQFVAWRLAFQPELGPAWFHLGGLPVYLPPAFFWWWYRFDAYAPRIFAEGAAIASGAGFACIAVAIAGSVWRAREAERATTYGTARWAEAKDIAGAGLFADRGVLLGRFDRHYLRHDGPEHVLCFAPPVPARASGWWCRPCWPGRARPSSTTSRARTGGWGCRLRRRSGARFIARLHRTRWVLQRHAHPPKMPKGPRGAF